MQSKIHIFKWNAFEWIFCGLIEKKLVIGTRNNSQSFCVTSYLFGVMI